MRRQVGVIGIDSLEPTVLERFANALPNFNQLLHESPISTVKSTFPVDTIPAWTTIITGLDPSNHGICYVYDVFDPGLGNLDKIDITHIKGHSVWDFASANDRKSLVVFPILMYPPWPIKGVMISKSPQETRVDRIRTRRMILSSPPEILREHSIPDDQEDLWGGYPGIKNLRDWGEYGRKLTSDQSEIGFRLLREEEYDLFFIYFHLLDIIQHRLWRYFDEKDPTCPGPNQFGEIILDYYRMFDSLVGKFIEQQKDRVWMVVSDHGHKSRPIKTVNLNEVLRQKGHLFGPRGISPRVRFQQKIRRMILEATDKLDLEYPLVRLMTSSDIIARFGKGVYSPSNSLKDQSCRARLSDFAGIKSYSYGGIEINRSGLSKEEYVGVRAGIIESLRGLREENSEKPLVKWIESRDDFFKGNYASSIFPDIVFELDQEYGVGWDISSDLIGKSYDHKIASGGHAKNGVWIIRGIDKGIAAKRAPNLADVTPTVLDVLGIDYERYALDGKSIFK